jgi:endonuclease/exonuclease/phosphatase family metal-dependent hydrolase
MRPAHLAIASLLLGCQPAMPAGEAGGHAAAVLRLVTWNVHDLFDEEDRRIPPGELDGVPSPAEVEAKLDRLGAVLLRLDADVVLLQEVENAGVLGRLGARAGFPEARLAEGNDPRGIDVAVLSRVPIRAYVSHLDDLDAAGRPLWPRDCVEVHLDAGGAGLVLVGSHFSSALSDDGARRALQAVRMRELADRLAVVGVLVVAGGDLNDGPTSAALAPLLGDGRWVDPLTAFPADAAWTWSGGGAREQLDHLVVPAARRGAVLFAGVAGGADVSAASDHRPVVLDLWVD